MSNETKRDVFENAVDALADAQASGGNIGHQDANLFMAEYDAALPDETEKQKNCPYDWANITDSTPRMYYLVRYYPKAAQHDYYLVRQGNTRLELPGYRGPNAQWTFEECQAVDPQHHYKWVLVEEDD